MVPDVLSAILRTEKGELRLPLRFVWNDNEHRLRAHVRLVLGGLLIFLFASLGSQYRPSPLVGENPMAMAANSLASIVPQAVGISIGVFLACLVVDRRTITDIGLDLDRGWWRSLAGGTALGFGVAGVSVVGGLIVGFIEITGGGISGGPGEWLAVAGLAAGFQLLYLVPEELFVRGYIITNIVEGFDGVSSMPRGVAAGIGIVVASLVFYVTHAGRGSVFGLLAAGFAVLLGVGYVLSGDLSVPIGIHFGINFAWVLLGTNPQSASLLRVSATETIAGSLTLPFSMVALHLVAAALGIVLVVWWYRAISGHVRVERSIARPTLRRHHDHDTTSESVRTR